MASEVIRVVHRDGNFVEIHAGDLSVQWRGSVDEALVYLARLLARDSETVADQKAELLEQRAEIAGLVELLKRAEPVVVAANCTPVAESIQATLKRIG